MAAGHAGVNGTSRFAAARLLADGPLDTVFNTVGSTTVAFSVHNDACFAVALQPDGKLVVGGTVARR